MSVLRSLPRVRLLAAVAGAVSLTLLPAAPAAGHGWSYRFISHDHLSNGVQAHGGIVTRYLHPRSVFRVWVNMRACYGDCQVGVTSDGKTFYAGGGRVRIVASNSRYCVRPPYRSYNGGYTCDAMTRVVSRRAPKFCWSTVFAYVDSPRKGAIHRGRHTSGLGNCR